MRKIIKLLLDLPCFIVAAIPAFIVKIFRIERRYSDLSVCLAYFPFVTGERVRYFYYKLTLSHVGNSVRFKFGSWVQYRSVKIGNNTLVGYFNSIGQCEIGSDVLFGGNVNILSGLKQHEFRAKNTKIREQGGTRTNIIIGNDVYIGSNSVIGANLESGCVIGAGSIVVDQTEEYGVYTGSRASLVSKRKENV